MNLESKDKQKKLGLKRFFKSFKYGFDGLAYAIRREQNIIVMTFGMIVALIAGILLEISTIEWIFVFISVGLVIGTELLNTSIEATIDLAAPEYKFLAKVAKDTAAAAVFIYSVVAFIIGCFIFIPKIINIIERM